MIGSAAYVARLPDRADFVAMAPILCAGVTTYKGIKETETKPGQWLAISGLGGLGHLAVQYAKAMGLHVAALDVTEEKLALARSLGADVTVDAKAPDAVQQIVTQTGGGAHGVLVTAVSPAAFAQALQMVRRKGTVSLVGLPPGDFPTPIFDVVLKRITIRGSIVGTRAGSRRSDRSSPPRARCARTFTRRASTTINRVLSDLQGREGRRPDRAQVDVDGEARWRRRETHSPRNPTKACAVRRSGLEAPRRRRRTSSRNTAAAPSSSRAPPMRSTSAICSSTASAIPRPPGRASASRRVARSVRDVLSQRWIRTEQTYERENPKRIYYLSMEFLIGRSLANNVMNLLLEPIARQVVAQKRLDWLGLLEQEPDAGLGNGGLGRLAACFLDSMATMQLPAMGYGLRYEYGMFRQTIEDGWQREQPDNWLRRPDPWEVARPDECVEVALNCSFELRAGALQPIPGRPSTLIGIPFDRPVVGYGGKTINTLRLWAAAARDYFDFEQFSQGDFVGALAESLAAESLTRVLYPDDSTTMGPGAALRAGVLPGRLLAGRPRPPLPAPERRLERAARPRRDPAERHPSRDGGAGADAHPARRRAPAVGPGLGPDAPDARLHQPHAAARGAREVAARLVRGPAPAPPRDHPRDQPPPPRRRPDALPRRRGPRRAREPRRGGSPSGRSGWPTSRSSARTARTAWRRSIPSCCGRRRSGTWPSSSPSASTTRRTA